jgi:hypothetical protein
MKIRHGYRIKVDGGSRQMFEFLDAFRREAFSAFARSYVRLVAKEVMAKIDAHHIGVAIQEDDGNPVDQAMASVGNDVATKAPKDMDMALDAYLAPYSDGYLYLWVNFAHPACVKVIETHQHIEAFPYADNEPPPSGVTEAEWKARSEVWARLLGIGGQAHCGLRLQLTMGKKLPRPTPDMLLRHLPNVKDRIEKAARTILMRQMLPDGLSKDQVGTWIGTQEGRDKWNEALAEAGKLIPKTLDAKMITRYGPSTSITMQPTEQPSINFIDKADMIELDDGKIIIVVFAAGLSHETNVHLQLGDDFIAFTQNGVQYGHVDKLPVDGLMLLRRAGTVTLVEVEQRGEESAIVGSHNVVVTDISSERSFSSIVGRLSRKIQQPNDKKIEELKKWV